MTFKDELTASMDEIKELSAIIKDQKSKVRGIEICEVNHFLLGEYLANMLDYCALQLKSAFLIKHLPSSKEINVVADQFYQATIKVYDNARKFDMYRVILGVYPKSTNLTFEEIIKKPDEMLEIIICGFTRVVEDFKTAYKVQLDDTNQGLNLFKQANKEYLEMKMIQGVYESIKT